MKMADKNQTGVHRRRVSEVRERDCEREKVSDENEKKNVATMATTELYTKWADVFIFKTLFFFVFITVFITIIIMY